MKEGVNELNKETNGAAGGVKGKVVSKKEKEPIRVEDFNLRVSDPSLAEGLRVLENPTFEENRSSKPLEGSNMRLKERVTKDVTNSLNTGPPKTKPNSNGLRNGSGLTIREWRIAKKKAQEVGLKGN